MFHTKVVGNIKTHILCPETLLENRNFYVPETLLENRAFYVRKLY